MNQKRYLKELLCSGATRLLFCGDPYFIFGDHFFIWGQYLFYFGVILPPFQAGPYSISWETVLNDCNCIVTRGGVYDETLTEPEGFPEGSGNISLYTLTQVTIQPFSITSISQYFLVFTSWAGEYFPVFTSWAGEYFPVFTFWGLCHGSFKSSLGNMLCLEGNIATVIFQYSIVRWLRMPITIKN